MVSGCFRNTDPPMALMVAWTTGLNIASDCSTCHSYPDVSWRQQSQRISPRHQSEAYTVHVHRDRRLCHGLGQQHEPQTPTWPLVALQTSAVLQGGLIQKANLTTSPTCCLMLACRPQPSLSSGPAIMSPVPTLPQNTSSSHICPS